MKILRRYNLDTIIIFIGSLILFTVGLANQEIIGFETRFYLFALEMWRHGPSWFPTTYQQPYPDYPVTATLLIYGFSSLMGHLNKFTAVFPSAVAAAITLVVTYLIGALQNRRWGWYAVFFMLLTNTFLMEARTISPDQYIGMVTALCFYLACSGKRLGFIPCLFLLGFAFRGPIGLVIPAGVLCVFYLLDANFKRLLITGCWAIAALLLGCIILFGIAYHAGGMVLVQDVLRMEVLGRMENATLPWYFYFTESIGAYAIVYPLAILMAFSFWKGVPIGEKKFLQKLLGWAFIILIGLSIPAGKKIRYILAFVPPLALISAYLFVAPKQKYFSAMRQVLYWFCYFFPIICMLIIGGVKITQPSSAIPADIAMNLILGLLLAMQSINIVGRKDHIVLASAALTFVAVYIMVVEPINLALNRTRDFVIGMEEKRNSSHAKLVFYHQSPDALPIKYMIHVADDVQPLFINNPNELLSFKLSAIFVADAASFSQIPVSITAHFKVVAIGKLGHEAVVVFAGSP
jgi:4-amino-4-deoxy-L-arabinose transferase-like glycosyltransferase